MLVLSDRGWCPRITDWRLSGPACRTLASAEALASTLPRTSAVALDVTSHADLTAVLSSHVVVVSLIPYTHHAAVIRAALTTGTHVVTTSYVNPEMQSLDADVKAKGLVVLNEVGMDPGIDHLYAVKTIGEVHDKGGKVLAKIYYYYFHPLTDSSCYAAANARVQSFAD